MNEITSTGISLLVERDRIEREQLAFDVAIKFHRVNCIRKASTVNELTELSPGIRLIFRPEEIDNLSSTNTWEKYLLRFCFSTMIG